MIEEVDAWFATLSEDQRGNDYVINQTSRVKARLKEFIKSGAFNAPTLPDKCDEEETNADAIRL